VQAFENNRDRLGTFLGDGASSSSNHSIKLKFLDGAYGECHAAFPCAAHRRQWRGVP
jgi:hypothetical protein